MVITNVNQVVYQGDGVTTAFPFTFRIIDATDIKLLLLDSDGTETDILSDYFVDTENDTVHYPGYAPGAEPALSDRPPVLAEGQKLVIYRKLPITQEKDLGDKWPFYVIELGLDKLTMILQDIWDWLGRCLYVSKGQAYEAGDDFDPTVPLEADKVICGNANGTGFDAREAIMEVNGHWDGKGRQIKGVADPAAAQDAVTKNYVDTLTDNNFLKLQPDGNAWEGRNLPISNVAGPALVKDAANKDYVDRILAGYSGYGERLAIFDNVAQMQAAELVPSQMAVTLGYHDVNDGGKAVYVIRAKLETDVDDGGSIIFLDNENYVAELNVDGAVRPEQWGAKGDGVTDDTVPLQRCFAFGRVVELGNKTYALDGCIEVISPTELYTDSTVLKVINSGVKDYDAAIKIVGNSTDYHDFHHQGKLYIECNCNCNIGLWIEARTPRLSLDWVVINRARIWGLYDNSSDANFKTAKFIACCWCGQFITANASYLASNKMEIEFVSGKQYTNTLTLSTPWFDNVFNNNFGQFDFVLDDSSYNINTAHYRRHNFGTPEDTGVLGTVNFNANVGVSNDVPSDYLGKQIFIPLGGGICFTHFDSSCWDIEFYQSIGNSRAAKINSGYNANFGSFSSESDGICMTDNLTYGTTISCYYEENLGDYLNAPEYKRIVLASFYGKGSTVIANGTFGKLDASCVLQSYIPSGAPSYGNLKQYALASLRDNIIRNAFVDYDYVDTTQAAAITENHPRIISSRRMWFDGSNNHFILDITSLACIRYAGFAPVVIYGGCQYTHAGAKMNIGLSTNLIDLGYTLKNSVDNQLSIDTSSALYYKVVILLLGTEFSVFFETLTPETNAT